MAKSRTTSRSARWCEADILLLLDSPGRKAGVPAKLYEYLGARRPILALGELDGDLAWVLSESGVPYRIAAPLDPPAIRLAMTELLDDPATLRHGGQGEPIQSRFTRKYLAGELAGLLDSCVSGSSFGVGGRSLSETAR